MLDDRVATPVDPQKFKNGMRRLAGAVCILTMNKEGQWAGLTATAVNSISAEPPRLMVCINRSVYAHSFIAPGRALCVNVLDAGQLDAAKRFAGMAEGVKGEDRFATGQWHQNGDDAPELDASLVRFQCRIAEVINASTHSIVLCDVVAVNSDQELSDPLVYFDGRFMAVAEPMSVH